MMKYLGQLCREAGRRTVLLLTGRIIYNSCFRGIGDDDLQIITGRHFHHSLIVIRLIGIQAPADAGDHSSVIHLLPFFAAPQIQGVESLLFIDHLCKSAADGLHQHAFAVPAGFLIGQIEPVIHKCSEEIAFTELKDLFGRLF